MTVNAASEKKGGAVIIVPAYNEAEYIGNMLESCMEAKRQGLVRDVVVVNDGSTDNTERIAREAGAKVVSFKRNKGKGQAFLLGVKTCKRLGADVLVTLDADLLNLKIGHIKELLGKVAPADVKMAVMHKYEGRMKTPDKKVSGDRALKMNAFDFLFIKGLNGRPAFPAKRFFGLSKGFGLELALNQMIKGTVVDFMPRQRLNARAALGGEAGHMRQVGDLHRTGDLIRIRQRKAENLIIERRIKSRTKTKRLH